MTPCEKKGYEVGQVFKYTNQHSGVFPKNTYVVLKRDDGSDMPAFDSLEGGKAADGTGDTWAYCSLDNIVRIYPPEEVKEPVETITLMGKEYNKQEIEVALADVLPVGE